MYSDYFNFHIKNNKITGQILVTVAVFLLFPLIGILIGFLLNITNRDINRYYLFSFFLLLAAYLGAVNATKIPISDQLNYMMAYMEVPQVGFVRSLTNIYGIDFSAIHSESNKELGFGLLNYVGYYISFGNYPLFVFLFSVVLYFLLFYSIFLFYSNDAYKNAKVKILSGTISIAFFTQFFNITIHLQRQEIAAVVMMLALVKYIVKEKRIWLLALAACSLHSSVILFVPFLILERFVDNKSRGWIAFMLFCFLFSISFVNYFGGFLSGLFGTSYVFDRMAQMGESNENRMGMSLVLLLTVPMLSFSIYKLFFSKNIHREKLMYLTYIIIASFVFLTPDNTLQYRYFMLSYVFIPFVFPQLFDFFHDRVTCVFLNVLIPSFLFFRFFYTFDDIIFSYAPLSVVMAGNFFEILTWRM